MKLGICEGGSTARTQLFPDPVGPTTLFNGSSSRMDGSRDDCCTHNTTISFSDISIVGTDESRLIFFHKSARNLDTAGMVG